MPYISTTTNVQITNEKELSLKSKYAQAISIIGKSESYLMLGFNPNCSMYFAGNSESPMAFVEVKFLGKSTPTKLNSLTAELCKIISDELDIEQSKIYIKYEEVEYWGWNGNNF